MKLSDHYWMHMQFFDLIKYHCLYASSCLIFQVANYFTCLFTLYPVARCVKFDIFPYYCTFYTDNISVFVIFAPPSRNIYTMYLQIEFCIFQHAPEIL